MENYFFLILKIYEIHAQYFECIPNFTILTSKSSKHIGKYGKLPKILGGYEIPNETDKFNFPSKFNNFFIRS